MKFRSCLATCSTDTRSTTTVDSTISTHKNRTKSTTCYSDTSSSSDFPGGSATSSSSSSSACSDTSCSTSSLQSNLSLQTLPSVPSLQKFTPETTQISVSRSCVDLVNREPKLPITCLAVHGSFLYAASSHEINVYDRATGTHLDAFNVRDSSTGSVKAVAVCNGKLFTAHQDCKIRVWQGLPSAAAEGTKRHKLITTLPTINDRLRRIIHPKNYVQVRRHKKQLWIEHSDAISALAVNNGLIYSVSWDKTLKIWRASDLRCLESVNAHDDAVNAVVVSKNGVVYTGSADRRIRVWVKPFNEKRHTLVATLEKHKSAVNALALSDDGSVLFSGACDRSILVWEREDSANHMSVTGALRGHGKAVLSLINVSDLLLSGSSDRTVRIWQRGHDGKYCCLSVLDGHSKAVKSLMAVGEDDSNGVVQVISGSLDGEIKMWQVFVSKPINPLSPDLLKWKF